MANLVGNNTEEHTKFKCALVALSVTGGALEDVTSDKLKSVHDEIIKKLGTQNVCGRKCSSQYRATNKWCSTCDSWRKALQAYMTRHNTRIAWDKMKSWEWPSCHRNISEVFIAPNRGTSNVILKDVSTSLSIWQRCSAFPKHIVQFSKPLQNARNEFFHVHATNLIMNETEKTSVFRAIYKVLNHGDVIPLVRNHNEIMKTLDDLRQGQLLGHEADLVEALKEIAGTNKALIDKMDRFKDHVDKIEKRTTVNSSGLVLLFVLVIPIALSCGVYMSVYIDIFPKFLAPGLEMNNELTSCLSETPHPLFKTGIHMEGYLVRVDRFVGRAWLFDALEEQMANTSTHRGVVIVAEMGYGKSVFLAQLICASKSDIGYKLRKKLVAYHICRFDVLLSKRGSILINRITSMIAQRVPSFAAILETDKACLENYDTDTCEQDPFGCLDQCLINPLRKAQLNQSEQYIIAIDALDECEDNEGGNVIFDLLNSDRIRKIPSMFKFVITSRNVPEYYALDIDFSFMSLRDVDDLNIRDITSFLGTSNVPSEAGDSIESGHNISNFLLASTIVDTGTSYESLEQFPKSLYKSYGQQFKRLFGNHFDKPKLILEILCTSLKPPTEEYVYKVISTSADIDLEVYKLIMKKLQHVTKFIGHELHLNHISLKNWLESKASGMYKLNIERGHMTQSVYMLNNFNMSLEIDVVDIAIHISYSSSRGKLMGRFHRMSINETIKAKIRDNDLPLHRLVKICDCEEAFKLLLYHFPDVNELNKAGISPLYLAAALGRIKIFKFLIRNNANINFRLESYSNVIHFEHAAKIAFEDRHWGYGIMDIASQNGQTDIVRTILLEDTTIKRYKFYQVNAMNLLPIHLACKLGHINVVELITEQFENMLNFSCLYFASENGNADVVKFALERGIEDTCRSCTEDMYWIPKGKTRVQGTEIFSDKEFSQSDYILFDDWYLIMCESAVHVAVRHNWLKIVQLLIAEPINALKCVDRTGRTPLISGIIYNFREIVQHIVSKTGFDTNMKCQLTEDITNSHQLGDFEINLLRSTMCEVDLSSLHIAAMYDRLWVFRRVEELGIDWTKLSIRDSSDCHIAHTAACHGSTKVLKYITESIEKNVLHLRCINGSTPLHSASVCGSVEIVDYLLQYNNLTLNAYMLNESSYLFSAVKRNVTAETADADNEITDSSMKIVECFIANGFDLAVTDEYNRNILHYAITRGHYKVISSITKSYSKINKLLTVKDIYGKIPIVQGIISLSLTHIVRLDINTSRPSLHRLSGILTPQEYSCLIILSYMKTKHLLNNDTKRRVLTLLIQNQRIALQVAFYHYIHEDKILIDSDIINYIKQHDKSGLVAPTYIYTRILHIYLIIYCDSDIWRKNLNDTMHRTLSTPCMLHELAQMAHFKISWWKEISDTISEVWNNVMTDVLFHKQYLIYINESFNCDGYNVLDRAIQGKNINAVKKLVEMGINATRNAEEILLWAMQNNNTDSAIAAFKSVEHSFIALEIHDKNEIFSKILDSRSRSESRNQYFRYLQELLTNDFGILQGFYSHTRNLTDTLTALLLNTYRNHISTEFICSPNSKNFSFVHTVSMQGLTKSLKVIKQLWGPAMTECENADKFTPLYLAKVFGNHEIVEYLEHNEGHTRVPKRKAEVHFIFKIWSRFLLDTNRSKNIHCLYRLKARTISNIQYGFRALKCIKHSAKILGIWDKMDTHLAEFKSLLVYFSNVNIFKLDYDKMLAIGTRISYNKNSDALVHLFHNYNYYYHRANTSCRVAIKAFRNSLSYWNKRISKSEFRKDSIYYSIKPILSELLRDLNSSSNFFADCQELFSRDMHEQCSCLKHTNVLKRVITSSKSRLRLIIKQLLTHITMHATKFYYTSAYISSRIMPDDFFLSGVWIWDHHLYKYMDVIKDMNFYHETYMINEGFVSEFLKVGKEIGRGVNYFEWNSNVREIVKQFTDKHK